jgi:alpha-D-ribose 1-methylphosphonate 5-triphosphate diphosphatase
MSEHVLSNAKLVFEKEQFKGSIKFNNGIITAIDKGTQTSKKSIDCNGDFVCPGLIELHTDNLERHMEPRPGVTWPLDAALLSHDSELASVGITTVYDALRVGSIISETKKATQNMQKKIVKLFLEMLKFNFFKSKSLYTFKS